MSIRSGMGFAFALLVCLLATMPARAADPRLGSCADDADVRESITIFVGENGSVADLLRVSEGQVATMEQGIAELRAHLVGGELSPEERALAEKTIAAYDGVRQRARRRVAQAQQCLRDAPAVTDTGPGPACTDAELQAALAPDMERANQLTEDSICPSAKAMHAVARKALDVTASCGASDSIQALRTQMQQLLQQTQAQMDGSCNQ